MQPEAGGSQTECGQCRVGDPLWQEEKLGPLEPLSGEECQQGPREPEQGERSRLTAQAPERRQGAARQKRGNHCGLIPCQGFRRQEDRRRQKCIQIPAAAQDDEAELINDFARLSAAETHLDTPFSRSEMLHRSRVQGRADGRASRGSRGRSQARSVAGLSPRSPAEVGMPWRRSPVGFPSSRRSSRQKVNRPGRGVQRLV